MIIYNDIIIINDIEMILIMILIMCIINVILLIMCNEMKCVY